MEEVAWRDWLEFPPAECNVDKLCLAAVFIVRRFTKIYKGHKFSETKGELDWTLNSAVASVITLLLTKLSQSTPGGVRIRLLFCREHQNHTQNHEI